MKSLFDFDNLFTAPMHGFRDAEIINRKCSGKKFIGGVRIPT
jgi:predicted alpha/beta-fold hydrolase